MPVKDNKNSAATTTPAQANAAQANAAQTPKGPVVVRRYRATGRADELGIHSIGHGYIVVEALTDGSFRIAPDQDAPLFDPSFEPQATEAAQEAQPDGDD